MLALVRHHVRVLQSKVREAAKRGHPIAKLLHPGEERSPQWREVEKKFLASYPRCAACAGGSTLQVHHVTPFHTDPSKELDPTNLISLCMGPFECHLRIGHGGNFKFANLHVRADAQDALMNPQKRSVIEQAARNARVPNAPGV